MRDAQQVGDHEDQQYQEDDPDDAASRCLVQLLVELRQLFIGQAADALLDHAALDTQLLQLVLHTLVVEHLQQLLAVIMLRLRLEHLGGPHH
ncbi:hypothetical protein D3C80_1479370 [compost metagenome]